MARKDGFPLWSTGSQAFRTAGGVAVLAGSGISVSSGLPTAWEFNREFKRFLATSPHEERLLEAALPFGYRSAGARKPVRFEQLLQMMRDTFDPRLRILRCYDEPVTPTYLHRVLGWLLSQSCPVFTTNFDSLIESAYVERYGDGLSQVHIEHSARGGRFSGSFERFVRQKLPMPALLKLHGTLRELGTGGHLRSRRTLALDSIGATLDSLGSPRGTGGLEPYKEKALSMLIKDRWLCVVGYSGSDDLDVLPSLARVLGGARGVIWIRHTSSDIKVSFGSTPHGKSLIPSQLHDAADAIPYAIVEGPTNTIMKRLTGFTPDRTEDTVRSPKRRNPVSDRLAASPYSDCTVADRKLLVARTMEIAANRRSAYRIYDEAASLAAGNTERSTRAYALGRMGHLERLSGEMPLALRHLKEARRLYSGIGRKTGVAFVTTSIGNVYLNQGKLGLALQAYKEAYRLNARISKPANRAARATNIGNIGIIYRKQGLFRDALSMYRRALKMNRQLRNKEGIVRDLGNIGVCLQELHRYREAASHLEQSLSLAQEIGRLENVAIQLLNLAVVYRHLGDLDKSLAFSEEAMALERQLGRREGIAECLSNIGSVRESRGEARQALQSYRSALRIERHIEDTEGSAVDLESIGRVLQLLGRHKEAEHAWRESREQYRKLGNKAKVSELADRLSKPKVH